MKGILMKAAVVTLMAVAATSAYVYRDAYLHYVPADWRGGRDAEAVIPTVEGVWVCTMHPHIQMDHPDICPICSMNLEFVPAAEVAPQAQDAAGDMEGMDMGTTSGGAGTAVDISDSSQALFTVDPRRQQLIGVRTSLVSYERFDRTIRTIGTVALDETRISEVHSKIGGWIEETFVDFQFQHVEKGDPLFTLYSPELVATQEEYLLALRGLEALGASSFQFAAFGAENLVAAARRRLELWDITPEQIEQLEKARQPIRTMTIYSPAAGHVMSRDAFPGKRITPDTMLYNIADHSVVWVKADVYENDIAWVREGQRAVMRVQAYPGREFSGRVTFIDPHVNEQTRTLTVRLEFPNPNLDLKPGMYADVELRVPMGRLLMVPESAVLPTGVRNVVFVDRGNGRMEIRNVQLGTRINDHYEVIRGLAEGERIVTSGNFLIDAESKLQSAEPVWGGPSGL